MTNVDTTTTRHPLTGLIPAAFLRAPREGRHAVRSSNRFSRSLFATVPILLIGSLAMSLAIASPADASPAKKQTKQKSATKVATPKVAKAAPVKTATAPSSYRVQPGDTVSSVAGKYGLSTASVLTLNGLGWKSLIYPGQVLKLNKAAASSGAADSSVARSYTIASGDTVSDIAKRHGVSTNAVLVANDLKTSSVIYAGQKLSIPDAGAFSSTDVDTVAIELVSNVTPSVTTYVIATGDTITSIAAKKGVSVASILAANGLDSSSLIYAGRTITIPKTSSYVKGHGVVTMMTAEMRTNAATIVAVGRELGATDRALVIALATAMQESGLRNIDYGDLDSVGLFQQRPSKGWGSVKQIMQPTYAARAFFLGTGAENPGLFDIRNWSSMSVTQAAQAVQVSAFPDAYAKWQGSAEFWLEELR